MVTLNALSTASTLLQQVSLAVSPSSSNQPASSILEETMAGMSPAISAATKSFSSAVFNAVSSVHEKQDEAVQAIMGYLEETYTKIEDRFANLFSEMNPDSAAAVIASAKALGERLKEQVLADPAAAHKLYEQIKSSHPDASQEGVLSLLVAELNSRHLRTSAL